MAVDKERNRGAYLQSFTGHGEILKEKTEIIKNPTIETQTFLNPLFSPATLFFFCANMEEEDAYLKEHMPPPMQKKRDLETIAKKKNEQKKRRIRMAFAAKNVKTAVEGFKKTQERIPLFFLPF